MFRPRQISFRFPSIIFFKRKVTPPDEELRTILLHPFFFHFTDEKFCLLLFDFYKGFLQARRGLRLLTHRFPTHIQGHLGLFPCFNPSHTPFPRQKTCSTSEKILVLSSQDREERLEKWSGTHLLRDAWGLFGKEA